MNTGGLILVVGTLLAATTAFIWLARRVGRPIAPNSGKGGTGQKLESAAREDVEHIFNDEFRE